MGDGTLSSCCSFRQSSLYTATFLLLSLSLFPPSLVFAHSHWSLQLSSEKSLFTLCMHFFLSADDTVQVGLVRLASWTYHSRTRSRFRVRWRWELEPNRPTNLLCLLFKEMTSKPTICLEIGVASVLRNGYCPNTWTVQPVMDCLGS